MKYKKVLEREFIISKKSIIAKKERNKYILPEYFYTPEDKIENEVLQNFHDEGKYLVIDKVIYNDYDMKYQNTIELSIEEVTKYFCEGIVKQIYQYYFGKYNEENAINGYKIFLIEVARKDYIKKLKEFAQNNDYVNYSAINKEIKKLENFSPKFTESINPADIRCYYESDFTIYKLYYDSTDKIKNAEEEIWYKHYEYINYEASNFGNIRKKINDRYVNIKQTQKQDGYLCFGCEGKTKNSHRFVWECINGEKIPKNMVIDHINTKRNDNRIVNLKAVSCIENMKNPLTQYHLRNTTRNKKVLQLDKETNEIVGYYPSIAEAERQTGYCSVYIRRSCEGKHNCIKYNWQYTDSAWVNKWGEWWKTN